MKILDTGFIFRVISVFFRSSSLIPAISNSSCRGFDARPTRGRQASVCANIGSRFDLRQRSVPKNFNEGELGKRKNVKQKRFHIFFSRGRLLFHMFISFTVVLSCL